MGQQGSVSHADLTLPPGSALLVQVSTSLGGLTADTGFFVRPTRLTREWGKATVGAEFKWRLVAVASTPRGGRVDAAKTRKVKNSQIRLSGNGRRTRTITKRSLDCRLQALLPGFAELQQSQRTVHTTVKRVPRTGDESARQQRRQRLRPCVLWSV